MKLAFHNWAFDCLALVVTLGCFCSSAYGEPLPLPEGIGPIPELTGATKSGIIVNEVNRDSYRALLPPELAEIVGRSELVLEVAKPKLPSVNAQVAPDQANLQVLPNGELQGAPLAVVAPLFSAQALAQSEDNKREQAYQVLWNAAAVFWSQRAFSSKLAFSIFRGPSVDGHQTKFIFDRIYPAALGTSVGTLKPLFREKISLQSPEVVKGLGRLSFRFLGATEDYLWAASALIQQVRQLTGSNRSDELFSGAFSLDDLMVWSGKVENIEPLSATRISLLVPFINATERAVVKNGGACVEVDFGLSALQLNGDSHRFPKYPSWIPTNVRMVPRDVWRIEYAALDAFSLDARQTIYIDAETSLPAYKVVWGLDGKLRNFVMGVIGFISVKQVVVPWPVGEVIVSPNGAGYGVLAAQSVQLCNAIVAGFNLGDFDPVAFKATVASK